MNDRDVIKSQKQRKKRVMSRRRDVIVKLENEHEVVQKAKNGCRDSMEVLYVQYLPFLRSTAAKLERCYKSVDFDDALQQGTVHFMEAVKTYEPGHGTGFKYWVVKCVSLQLISFWKTQIVIKIPKWPENEELKKASMKCGGVVRFSEMSRRDRREEACQIDPADQSSCQPVDIAILSEEKEILDSAIRKLDPLDRVLVQGRLKGKFYEECGEDVCRQLNMNISTHRESVRQRASRSFLRLRDRIYDVIGERRAKVSQNAF